MASRMDGYQVTVAPLLVEQDNAWQKLLLGGFNNIRVAAHWVRHLGLPDTSVADKLPYWRCAMYRQSFSPRRCPCDASQFPRSKHSSMRPVPCFPDAV